MFININALNVKTNKEKSFKNINTYKDLGKIFSLFEKISKIDKALFYSIPYKISLQYCRYFIKPQLHNEMKISSLINFVSQ